MCRCPLGCLLGVVIYVPMPIGMPVGRSRMPRACLEHAWGMLGVYPPTQMVPASSGTLIDTEDFQKMLTLACWLVTSLFNLLSKLWQPVTIDTYDCRICICSLFIYCITLFDTILTVLSLLYFLTSLLLTPAHSYLC